MEDNCEIPRDVTQMGTADEESTLQRENVLLREDN